MAYVEESIELFTDAVSRINSTSDVPIYSTNNYPVVVMIDTSKWVNPTFYLNVSAKAVGTGNDTVVSLYDLGTSDDSTTTGTQVSSSEITITSTSNALYSSSALTLTSGNRYLAKVRQTTASTSTAIYSVRLIVVDNIGTGEWTKVESHIIMSSANQATTSASYVEPTYSAHYDHDSSAFTADTIVGYLEATMKTSNASGTAYLELWNATDSTQVKEISTTATTMTRVRSGTSFTLTTGKEYYIRIKNNGTYTTTATCARIILQLSGHITEMEQHKYVGTQVTTTATSYGDSGALWKYVAANYPTTPTKYFKPNMKISEASYTAYMQLYDGTNQLGEQTTTTTTMDSYKSSAITMTDGNEFRARYKVSDAAGTNTASVSWVVLNFTYTPSGVSSAWVQAIIIG